MKKIVLLIVIVLTTFGSSIIFSQAPRYFSYNDESGIPSNEVYSITQDQKGFIWLGYDAGLYKFDGIRYISYKSEKQNSTPFTNLSVSPAGAVFGINFQNQIFFTQGDSLIELKHHLQKVNRITFDKNGLLYASHEAGIASYNLTTHSWTSIPSHDGSSTFYTGKVSINKNNEVFFKTSRGIGKILNGKVIEFPIPGNDYKPKGSFLACHNDEVWFFSNENHLYYTFQNGNFIQNKSKKLTQALRNRKVNFAKVLADGYLWIATFNGIIRYAPESDEVQIFYPELAFSDLLLDRENNYWFTTLQKGILRVPNMNYWLWNSNTSSIKNDKFTHLATDGTTVYFAGITNGIVGKINPQTHESKTFDIHKSADIESFYFDLFENRLLFHSQYETFQLKKDTVSVLSILPTSIKDICYAPPYYFIASSQGLYVQKNNTLDKISNIWCRELTFDPAQNALWVASNSGLMHFSYHKNQWIPQDTLLKNNQILSFTYDEAMQQILTLVFDGRIYLNDQQITKVPGTIHPGKIKRYKNKLYLTSNKGVWIWDIIEKTWENIDITSGLASNNVQDLLLLNDNLWLATGKGVQKIPLNEMKVPPLAKVYVKNVKADHLEVPYNQNLTLPVESSIYSSNGNFEYAYRINQNEWIKLPATISQIEIQNLPSGNFEIEIKTIDHLGRDSENIVKISGYAHPAFWRTWWFIIVIALLFILAVFLISREIIARIRIREHEKSELHRSQLKAIRAQMNPHFIYNTLNSIQDLILQQDIKNTNYYLSRFSQLMRQILAFSEEEKVLLSEEIEMLQNYLELEKLRFGNDFSFQLTVDKSIDKDRTYIPSLVVQPFVENAIKHGLLHKKGQKELSIQFYKKSGHLEIVIKDNGIGRKRSAAIKLRSGFTHKSFSGNAIHKRIKLLNKSEKYNIYIHTEDLLEHEENTGTQVKIEIENL